MALVQLVAVGAADQHIQNRAAQQHFSFASNEPLAWGRRLSAAIPRNADILDKIQISLKVGAAPEGYVWKRGWFRNFVEKMNISIGGSIWWSVTSDMLQMEYLIHGSQGPAECLFDLSLDERKERSLRPHELLFEPLRLAEGIVHQKGIPLIALQFFEIRLELWTGSLADCLEPIVPNPPPLPVGEAANQLLHQLDFFCLYTFLDDTERREVARVDHTYPVIQWQHDIINIRPGGRRSNLRMLPELICTATYIWITDTEGKEIRHQVLDRLQLRVNGAQTRADLTGLQARHAMRDLLPHPIVENNKSQNLYYLSYFPGRRNPDGSEQGLNFSRIDNSTLELYFQEEFNQEVKIHIVHRSNNIAVFAQGMAGLRWFGGGGALRQEGIAAAAPVQAANVAPARRLLTAPEQLLRGLIFENPEKAIHIPEDETQCMITYTDFTEGQTVEQCGRCHKIFSADGIFNWLKTRQQHQWKCVHCQGPYGVGDFSRGKAHLPDAAAAPNEAVVAEEEVLIQEEEAAPGFLHRVLGAIRFMEPE